MITISLDEGGMHRAVQLLADQLDARLRQGMDATLEAIAARAKQTTTFVDRTGALRNSIQSDGATGNWSNGTLQGVVSFAATSGVALRKKRGGKRRRSTGGYLYGLAQEFGTRTGVREKRFIRDAIDAQDGAFLDGALKAAIRAAGFEVA